MKVFVYDVEVLRGPEEVDSGWRNPEAMGFGTAVVYDYSSDFYRFFGPDEKDKMTSLMMGGRVISFNGVRFDNKVVFGNDYPTGEAAWVDCDLLLKVVQSKFRVNTVEEAEAKVGPKEVHDGSIGLDGLAEGTLGLHKSGHGAKAPLLIREGRWTEVFEYNLNDVRLTKKLYDFAVRYGYLIDRKGNQIFIVV